MAERLSCSPARRVKRRWLWLRLPLMSPLIALMALGNRAEELFDWLDGRLR